MQARQQGFTLLEILVVMLLTAMITSILMMGLQQMFRLQTHFATEAYQGHQLTMQANWFRQTIHGLMPDYQDGRNKFKGTPRQMTGLTTAPLNASEGALLPFQWRIDFDPRLGQTALYYGEYREALPIYSWQGNSGRFIYEDDTGRTYDEWPPMLGKPSQLPRLIQLEMGNSVETRKITVFPRGPDKPWPRQRDVLAG